MLVFSSDLVYNQLVLFLCLFYSIVIALHTNPGTGMPPRGGSLMVDLVGQQLSNYLLVRLLGQGGFGDVYLGEHTYLKSPAAIKVLHTALSDKHKSSFLTKAQHLVRLRHPHIVRFLECG